MELHHAFENIVYPQKVFQKVWGKFSLINRPYYFCLPNITLGASVPQCPEWRGGAVEQVLYSKLHPFLPAWVLEWERSHDPVMSLKGGNLTGGSVWSRSGATLKGWGITDHNLYHYSLAWSPNVQKITSPPVKGVFLSLCKDLFQHAH